MVHKRAVLSHLDNLGANPLFLTLAVTGNLKGENCLILCTEKELSVSLKGISQKQLQPGLDMLGEVHKQKKEKPLL